MCGFVGAYRLDGGRAPPDLAPDRLERIRHRGPDGAGWHQDDRARLGFRRLAIIDLTTGMQPIANEDGRVVAVVNGEIYNHAALRRELVPSHWFRTRSDAEVVLHGYEEWGDAVFGRLRGMFAAVVVDRVRERLVLARDRVGKKPLYYRVDDGVLRFASEIAPLRDDAGWAVDREALNDYLRFGYVPAPRTLFAGVRKLPAGCILVAEEGRVEVRRWSPLLLVAAERGGDPVGWAGAVRETLAEAVRARLESEVPLGFLLSGGVDSAAVFALGASALGRPAHAFTVGFDEADVDETGRAAEVARRYRAEHRVRVLARGEAPALAAVVARCEEPVATDALLPTDRLFAAVRAAGITTVLAGEGADEVFAGYRKFGPAAAAVAGDDAAWRAAGDAPLARYLAHEEFCFPTSAERTALLGEVATDEGFGWVDDAVEHLDPLSQMLAVEVALRLPDRINLRLDRLSMAYGIEARAPFMDPAVADLALRVPHVLRGSADATKRVLRDALAADLPEEVRRARKAPFRAPDRWFVGGGEGVTERQAHEAGLVDGRAVGRLRVRAAAGDAAARERLYSLTVLHLWHRHVVRGEPVPGDAPPD